MESEKGPPDRRKPSQKTLVDAVRFACHQPKYRCNLRNEAVVLEYLDALGLNSILAACNVNKSMTVEAREARELICRYLQRYEATDRDWLQRREAAQRSQQLDMDMECDAEKEGVQYHSVSLDNQSSGSQKSKQRPTGVPSRTSSVVEEQAPPVASGSPLTQDVLEQMTLALNSAAGALATAAKFIQSFSEGRQLSANSLAGMVTSLEQASAATTAACSSLVPRSAIKTHPKPATYAQAASKATVRKRSHQSKRNTSAVRAMRQQVAQEKAALRADRRSLKLKPSHPCGALAFGSLARAVYGWIQDHSSAYSSFSLKELIEDVRMDSRGQYYLQFPVNVWQDLCELVSESCSADDSLFSDLWLSLPELGKFRVRMPTVASTAGMLPMVISGVPVEASPTSALDEIWSANHARWGMALADRDRHLAGLSRLQFRHQPAEVGPVEYRASRSVKVFVSRDVFASLKAGANVLRYEYSHLAVHPFAPPQRVCSRCGATSRHTAATCRRSL